MNKAEIICYIISAYFFGISTGCFISRIIHNSIYKRKPKKCPRLPKSIDEMHILPVSALVDADIKLVNAPKSCRHYCVTAMVKGFAAEEPTGCEYQLPLQYDCRECPHWSESRYTAAFGKVVVVEGFAAGMTGTSDKARINAEVITSALEKAAKQPQEEAEQ